MTDSVCTWGSIIDVAGGTAAVATGLCKSESTVSGWRKRPGGIPAEYWSSMVRLAAEAGNPEITLEVLASLAARKQSEEARA